MIVLLACILLLALFLIPLGLPGIWLMVLAGGGAILLGVKLGWIVVIGCAAIALVSEILDFVFAARYTKKYGGSTRGAWGAVIGGIAGAIVGVPVPIIGSVIGAVMGAFAGAMVGEYTGGASHAQATRAATGATIGRVVATAFKIAAGCVIATWILAAALI